LCTRIDAYKNDGYFAPETAETLKSAARARSVTHPMAILRAFAARYSR
jgi:GMP synthase (glutamine-hydrolysing)